MKRNKIVSKIFFFTLCYASLNIHAQTPVVKGNKSFNKLAYSEAIGKYEKILHKNPTNLDALNQLAICYRLTNQSILLEDTYKRILKTGKAPAEQQYNYALALIANGKYDEAKSNMQQYADVTHDIRADDYLKTLMNMNAFYKDSGSYSITKLSINSANADFSPALYKDGIVFASSRTQPGLIFREHSWTGQPFLSLYYSKGKESDFREPVSFGDAFKTKFNDGPVSFSKSGEVVYITRNNIEKGKVKKNSTQVVKLKIFEAINSSGSWKKITNFPYNSNDYNCAHPSLSNDGNQLFFSSDMPGGFGGMDLYICKKENGSWSKPQNLGNVINTDGNELFPYVHEDTTLFFASNGHEGMGGLDIYSSTTNQLPYQAIKNLGAPINSYDDDFALVFDTKNKTGYFCSNRDKRGLDDDIYSFSRTLTLRGIVVDKRTGNSIESATVTLTNPVSGKQEVITLDDGKFSFPVDFDQDYAVSGTKTKMGEDTKLLSTIGMSPADDPFVKLELENNGIYFTIQVNVRDADTKEPIDMAVLKVEKDGHIFGNSNQEGSYKQDLEPNTAMNLGIYKRGYSSKIISVSNTGLLASKDFVYDVFLKSSKDLEGLEEWYKIIYYDLDKSNIRPHDAVPTMEDVVVFMKENPRAIIKLSAHTDSRASKEYNILLSQRRAISAKKYLVDRGISADRISDLEWTGESILINNCGDQVYCPEADHQLNRRTEITVKKLKRKK